ncbi:hypothetical protein QCE63_32305 [Caballeronia sp. LZ065]|uniref:hypothetical protein n=1 Tax=Caballeronia sp. LZ065 TaxID=3038571 RepID=UPI00285D0E8C|nr:hypothetical protein [Caballeronia sp. LZ065]MDR5784105.1 hypothetical protein [Caballeronia sp. LZ065]
MKLTDVQIVECLDAADKSLKGKVFETPGFRDIAWTRALLSSALAAEGGEVCGNCNGTGRMVRDPDIGMDQECFSCDGTGKFDAAPQSQVDSGIIDCGECACLPGFCDKQGDVRSVLRLIVNKIDEEGPASHDWKGFNHLCELAKELLDAPQSQVDSGRIAVTYEEVRERIEHHTDCNGRLDEHGLAIDLSTITGVAAPQSQGEKAVASEDARDAERLRELTKTLSNILHDYTTAMQAALIEWKHGKGADAGFDWIINTLDGPGLLPDFDAEHGTNAQFWFSANCADPMPKCFCGNPSNTLWMGQGFCCREHYAEAKAKYDAATAKEKQDGPAE